MQGACTVLRGSLTHLWEEAVIQVTPSKNKEMVRAVSFEGRGPVGQRISREFEKKKKKKRKQNEGA